MHRYVVLGIQKVDLKKMEVIEVGKDGQSEQRQEVVRSHAHQRNRNQGRGRFSS